MKKIMAAEKAAAATTPTATEPEKKRKTAATATKPLANVVTEAGKASSGVDERQKKKARASGESKSASSKDGQYVIVIENEESASPANLDGRDTLLKDAALAPSAAAHGTIVAAATGSNQVGDVAAPSATVVQNQVVAVAASCASAAEDFRHLAIARQSLDQRQARWTQPQVCCFVGTGPIRNFKCSPPPTYTKHKRGRRLGAAASFVNPSDL